MKQIISTGSPIDYALTSSRRIQIDTVTPIEVSDEEYSQIQSVLGSQISVVGETAPVVDESITPADTITAQESTDGQTPEAVAANAPVDADDETVTVEVPGTDTVVAPEDETVTPVDADATATV